MSVKSALSQLNIPIRKDLGDRILTNCVANDSHNDSDPSCYIWLDTGVIYCHGCKESTNIVKIFQQRFNVSYQEAEMQIFGFNSNVNIDYIDRNFIDNLQKEIKKNEQKVFNTDLASLSLTSLAPNSYLTSRGWTEDLIKLFNIQLCISDKYVDYAIIPIESVKLNIYTLEARKIYELEYLQKILKSNSASLDRLKSKFIKNYESYQDSIYYEYLMKPKTLYEWSAPTDKMLFNYDNLNFNKDLVIVEGLMSVAKIYSFITNNITSCFGSKSSPTQIKLLRKFKKRIIVVSDNDLASYLYILQLQTYLNNIYVYDCDTEDTKDSFVNDLLTCNIVPSNEFVMDRDILVLAEKLQDQDK